MVKMIFSLLSAFTLLCSGAAEFPNVPICGHVVGERADGNTSMTNGEWLGYACRYRAGTNEYGIVTYVGGYVKRDFETQVEANAFAAEFVAAVVKKYGVMFEFSALDDGRHSYTYRKNRKVSFTVYPQCSYQRQVRGAWKHYYSVDFGAFDYTVSESKVMQSVGDVKVRKCDYDVAIKKLRFDPAVAEALGIMSNLITSAQWAEIPDGISIGGYRFGESVRPNENVLEEYFSILRDDPHVLEGDAFSTLAVIPNAIPIREWPYELDDVRVHDRVAKGDYTPITGRFFLFRFCEMHPETAFTCDEALRWTSKIQADIEKDTGEAFVRSRVNTNNPEQVSVSFTNATYQCWVNVSLREDMSDVWIDVRVGGKCWNKEKPKRVCIKAQISDSRLWERARQEAKILEDAARKVRVPDIADAEIISACRAIEAERIEKMRRRSAETQR